MRQLRGLQERWWVRLIAGALILATLSACGAGSDPAPATLAGSEPVAPRFMAFYEANGGLRTFGYPITRDFVDEEGRTVQYYQNMLLLAPGDGAEVTVAPLGEWALGETPGFPGEPSSASDGFRAFYEAHGGEALFGEPLTPRFEEAGRWVQYFRNAKLEWHPEEPPNLRVQVGALGLAHYWHSGAALRYQTQSEQSSFRGELLSGPVAVSVAASAPVLFGGETQGVTVSVRNGGDAPVAGMRLAAEVLYFDGETEAVQPITLPATDTSGLARTQFALPDAEPGHLVRIRVIAFDVDGSEAGQSQTSFKVWW